MVIIVCSRVQTSICLYWILHLLNFLFSFQKNLFRYLHKDVDATDRFVIYPHVFQLTFFFFHLIPLIAREYIAAL